MTEKPTPTCVQYMDSSGNRPHDPIFCGKPAKYVDNSRERHRPLCGVHAKCGRSVHPIVPVRLDVYNAAQLAGVDVYVTRDTKTWEATIEWGEHVKVSVVYYTPPDDNFWKLILEDLQQ